MGEATEYWNAQNSQQGEETESGKIGQQPDSQVAIALSRWVSQRSLAVLEAD